MSGTPPPITVLPRCPSLCLPAARHCASHQCASVAVASGHEERDLRVRLRRCDDVGAGEEEQRGARQQPDQRSAS